jgi:hypothetical protein
MQVIIIKNKTNLLLQPLNGFIDPDEITHRLIFKTAISDQFNTKNHESNTESRTKTFSYDFKLFSAITLKFEIENFDKIAQMQKTKITRQRMKLALIPHVSYFIKNKRNNYLNSGNVN